MKANITKIIKTPKPSFKPVSFLTASTLTVEPALIKFWGSFNSADLAVDSNHFMSDNAYIMGNTSDWCTTKHQAPVDMMRNIEELYDPFAELKQKSYSQQDVISQHAPSYANFVTALPHYIVKKEAEIRDKFQDNLKLQANAFLLRTHMVT